MFSKTDSGSVLVSFTGLVFRPVFYFIIVVAIGCAAAICVLVGRRAHPVILSCIKQDCGAISFGNAPQSCFVF